MPRKLYAQLYTKRSDGTYVERLGSDGTLFLDARWGIPRASAFCSAMCRVRQAAAFRLYTGSIAKPQYLTPISPALPV